MACPTGKAQHLSKPAADKAAKRARQRTETGLASYHCPTCQQWHVGNTQGRIKAPIKTIFNNHQWRFS